MKTTPETVRSRLVAIRAVLATAKHDRGVGVDAVLIPSADAHQNEYVPACWRRREYISGFDGSAGEVVVGADWAGLWTDGRYWTQAEEQLAGTTITLYKSGAPGVAGWREKLAALGKGRVVGVDPRTVTLGGFDSLRDALARRGVSLVSLEANPVDAVWADRPALPSSPVRAHPVSVAGKTAAEKLHALREAMRERGCDAHVVTALDSIAWLFNLRGADVECNPVFVSYAIVTLDSATLFTNPARVREDAKRSLDGAAQIRPYEEFEREMRDLRARGASWWIDEHAASKWVADLAGESIAERGRSWVFEAKAIKNDAEIAGMRSAHVKDGVAVVQFMKWLEEAVQKGGVTELSASARITRLRSEQECNGGPSFEPISGYAGHGAVIHYRVTEDSSLDIGADSLYLIDSGGQYGDGTTDITRTLHLGEPTDRQRRHFTLVLKAFIALDRQRFPEGATGAQLDGVARSHLWNAGLQYNHGTGHGVGAALNVHEEPPRINGVASGLHPIRPGMIFSNEPGYYIVGEYGIRIENLVLVVRDEELSTDAQAFLRLESLTLAPIQLKLVEPSLLTRDEIAWLDAYHARVRETLSPMLDEEHRAWLERATAPLAEHLKTR